VAQVEGRQRMLDVLGLIDRATEAWAACCAIRGGGAPGRREHRQGQDAASSMRDLVEYLLSGSWQPLLMICPGAAAGGGKPIRRLCGGVAWNRNYLAADHKTWRAPVLQTEWAAGRVRQPCRGSSAVLCSGGRDFARRLMLRRICISMRLLIDDAEHQLQVLSDARSPAALRHSGGWLHRSDAVRSHHAAISGAYMRVPFAPSM
jgi:hypothetical protein